MTTRFFAIAAAACLALAACSLLAAHTLAYDAWAWLVWGRELLALDTSSGPAFKPLPVAIGAVLSPAGDAAPALWLVLVRASWLLAIVLAGALAYRLTVGLRRGLRLVAAGFAGLCLLLLLDEVTAWTRQAALGMSEPLLVALVLGAVAAALDGRSRLVLVLAGLAALVRPEAWPLLAAYGLWRWRAEPALRPWIAALALAVPALWIVPDLLASGVASGGRALRGDGTPLQAIGEVLRRAATMPLAVAWPLAAFATAGALLARGTGGKRRHGGRFPPDPSAAAVLVLAGGALGWIAVVAVMAAAGFPGLPRFMAPALAIVGVLAGVGLARLLALAPRPVAVALVVLALLQLPGRVAALPDAIDDSERAAHSTARIQDLARDIGRERLLRCGNLATTDVLVRTALAWELDVPLPRVVSFGAPPRRSGAFVVGPGATPAATARLRTQAELIGERGEWRVYSLRCSPTAEASSSRSDGVAGARR